MQKYIAFLRAINVGGHVVKMDQLRGIFEKQKFSSVETFIASGNVIFAAKEQDAQALEQRIEKALQKALGYRVATFLRTTEALAEIAAHRVFAGEESGTLYIGFLSREPGAEAQRKLQSFASAVNAFHVEGREVYWLCRAKMLESEFSGALLEKTLGLEATLRNVNTVRKLAAKYCGG